MYIEKCPTSGVPTSFAVASAVSLPPLGGFSQIVPFLGRHMHLFSSCSSDASIVATSVPIPAVGPDAHSGRRCGTPLKRLSNTASHETLELNGNVYVFGKQKTVRRFKSRKGAQRDRFRFFEGGGRFRRFRRTKFLTFYIFCCTPDINIS